MMSKKECTAFKDLAKLIKETTWIETELESMGGIGSGIYDRYDSLRTKFPQSMEKKLIDVATVRNNAVHGNPKIEDLNKTLQECLSLKKIIFNRRLLETLLQELKEANKQLKELNINKEELPKKTQRWLHDIAAQKKHCKNCEDETIKNLVQEKQDNLLSIAICINNKTQLIKIQTQLQNELKFFQESGESIENLSTDFREWKNNFDTQFTNCNIENKKKFFKESKKQLSSLKRHLIPFKLKQFFYKNLYLFLFSFAIALFGLYYMGVYL